MKKEGMGERWED